MVALYAWRVAPILASPWNPHVIVLPTMALIVVAAAILERMGRALAARRRDGDVRGSDACRRVAQRADRVGDRLGRGAHRRGHRTRSLASGGAWSASCPSPSACWSCCGRCRSGSNCHAGPATSRGSGSFLRRATARVSRSGAPTPPGPTCWPVLRGPTCGWPKGRHFAAAGSRGLKGGPARRWRCWPSPRLSRPGPGAGSGRRWPRCSSWPRSRRCGPSRASKMRSSTTRCSGSRGSACWGPRCSSTPCWPRAGNGGAGLLGGSPHPVRACGLSGGRQRSGPAPAGHGRTFSPRPQQAAAAVLAEALKQRIPSAAGRPIVKIEQDAWPVAAGVLLNLQKSGVPFAVEEDWLPMFSDVAAATGRETEVVEIIGRERHFLLTSDGRAVTIAEAGPFYLLLLTPPVQTGNTEIGSGGWGLGMGLGAWAGRSMGSGGWGLGAGGALTWRLGAGGLGLGTGGAHARAVAKFSI